MLSFMMAKTPVQSRCSYPSAEVNFDLRPLKNHKRQVRCVSYPRLTLERGPSEAQLRALLQRPLSSLAPPATFDSSTSLATATPPSVIRASLQQSPRQGQLRRLHRSFWRTRQALHLTSP